MGLNTKMKIIHFQEKNADRYFVFNSDEELKKIFLKILKERQKEGYFNEDYLHKEKATELIKNGEKCSVWGLRAFFNLRKDYEYENYDISEVESIK